MGHDTNIKDLLNASDTSFAAFIHACYLNFHNDKIFRCNIRYFSWRDNALDLLDMKISMLDDGLVLVKNIFNLYY